MVFVAFPKPPIKFRLMVNTLYPVVASTMQPENHKTVTVVVGGPKHNPARPNATVAVPIYMIVVRWCTYWSDIYPKTGSWTASIRRMTNNTVPSTAKFKPNSRAYKSGICIYSGKPANAKGSAKKP